MKVKKRTTRSQAAQTTPATGTITIGQNVEFYTAADGTFWFGIDPEVSLGQTAGSLKSGKSPNEKVASTGAAVQIPGSPARILLQCYQPMDVQKVRKQRALRELEEDEDDHRAADRSAAAAGGVSDADLDALAAKLLAKLGVS